MRRTVLIAAVAMLASVPARADDFCDALKQVIADAKGDFPNIRGVHESDDGALAQFYPSPSIVLPGWECRVETGGGGTYTCSAPQGDLIALRDRVTACVGVQPEQVGDDYTYAMNGTWNAVQVDMSNGALEIEVNSPSDPARRCPPAAAADVSPGTSR